MASCHYMHKRKLSASLLLIISVFKNVILIVFIVQKKNSWISHICGVQLFFIINAGHSDLTLTAHGKVIGVACDEAHFCRGRKQSFVVSN